MRTPQNHRMSLRYGLIGNCKSAALVSESGSIEWCCLPNFDSPAVFSALLDPKAGHFAVVPVGEGWQYRQAYLPQTNVLQTIFESPDAAFSLVDFMPRFRKDEAYSQPVEIHRLLKPLKGRPKLKISFQPRLNYAEGETTFELQSEMLTAARGPESLFLYSSLPLDRIHRSETLELSAEEFLLLTYHERMQLPTMEYCREMLEKTVNYWEGWSRHCRLPKISPEEVLRSALILKLMTFQDTGAIIAAPTTSLPEILGEGRNWDYRFCWLRDASLMLEALKRVGHFEEARSFIHFLLRIFECRQTKVQIVYGIDGRTQLEEQTLPWLRGYKNSPPVRIGNLAYRMKQNDIFGEVVNTLYLYYFHYQFERMPEEVWSLVKFLVETVSREWRLEDAGIWEYRARQAHFTYSKLLSWVAMDRGARIAEAVGRPKLAAAWRCIADEIHADVLAKGWNPEVGSFTQFYGSTSLDVSLLKLHSYGFLDAEDPRWVGTVKCAERVLLRDGFGFRYTTEDDFGTPTSSFILATFWICDALFSIGEKQKARDIFERVLKVSNHLGLLSEDIDPATGELLGNFPQAYSHMSVINTAYHLSKA